jgi:diguanylate cyclase (GGDEF)-like protein
MVEDKTFPFNRLLVFLVGAIVSITALNLFSGYIINHIPGISPILFPAITIILMVFHFLIASFMLMKYLCDKHRLYLMAIACAFAGSAILMLGSISCYSDWMLSGSLASVRFNDALIYYFFRNILMAVLFTSSVFLYKYRHSNIHTLRNHVAILSLLGCFTGLVLILAWLYSSHYAGIGLHLIDNLTHQYSPLWREYLIGFLVVMWCVTLAVMIVITRMRNIFWYSGYLFCICYIFIMLLLQPSFSITSLSWYQARLFETCATMFLLLVLLGDVFTLYKESNNNYLRSYQNSIRDPMTALFNRSYFYDSLRNQMAKASANTPMSVIVCDLDHFKRINDNYGHLQGDKVIQFVAGVLQAMIRKDDIAARIGGEEFALLLVNTDAQSALNVAERIRETMSQHDENSSHGHLPERVTLSLGVFTALQPPETPEICVQRADEAMYQAKESGRNRVVVWQK